MHTHKVMWQQSKGNVLAQIDAPIRSINLLAFVHLRNIHASTGAGRTARQLVEHLAAKQGIALQVLADASDKQRILPVVGQPWTDYFYHSFTKDTSAQQMRWFLTDRPPAESFWPEAEVVYCTGESYVPVQTAKLAVTVHDAGYFDQNAHQINLAYIQTRFKWNLLFRKLERRADLIHTVSHFSAERLAHHFPGLAPRIRVVHNGVTPLFFGPVAQEGIEYLRQNQLADRLFVLVPGGLHYRKNADLILAALPALLQRFPDLVVAVVNHANPRYAAEAKKLGPRCRLLGFVSDAALHALYSRAAVVWYPSRYEGFGLPIVEAMACGTAVLGSNSSSIPEIAGDAALLVDPADATAHVEALSMLLTDEAARQALSDSGRRRAHLFTWERSATQLREHFAALL